MNVDFIESYLLWSSGDGAGISHRLMETGMMQIGVFQKCSWDKEDFFVKTLFASQHRPVCCCNKFFIAEKKSSASKPDILATFIPIIVRILPNSRFSISGFEVLTSQIFFCKNGSDQFPYPAEPRRGPGCILRSWLKERNIRSSNLKKKNHIIWSNLF